MARIKSDNRHLGILSGYECRWIHSGAAGNVTVTQRAGEPVVLHRIVLNTTSASAIVLVDTQVGVIGVLKASVSEGVYLYNIRLRGNLRVENPGGSDLTIVFSND